MRIDPALGDLHKSLFKAMPFGTVDCGDFFSWNKIGGEHGESMMEKSISRFLEMGFKEIAVQEVDNSEDGFLESGVLFKDEMGNELVCYKAKNQSENRFGMKLNIAPGVSEENNMTRNSKDIFTLAESIRDLSEVDDEATPEMKKAAEKMAKNAAPDDVERQKELIPKFLKQMIKRAKGEEDEYFDDVVWISENINFNRIGLSSSEKDNLIEFLFMEDKLDPKQEKELERAIIQTWAGLAPDVLHSVGGVMSAKDAVEVVLDDDNIVDYGGIRDKDLIKWVKDFKNIKELERVARKVIKGKQTL